MAKTKKYYLAYGSNLNVRQMKLRCPTARPIGTAFIPDYELLFRGSKTGSYLTIEQKPGGMVPVAVWDVTKDDVMRLDRYEGFPTFYYKRKMKLPVKSFETGLTQIQNTFVYIMHGDRPLGVPSSGYMRTCAEGYEAFGFDLGVLNRAYTESVRRAGLW